MRAIILILILMAASVSAAPLSVLSPDLIEFSDGSQENTWKIIYRGDASQDYTMFGTDLKTDQVEASNDFKLSSSIVSEQCTYSLTEDNNRPNFYKYRIETFEGNWPWQVDDVLMNRCGQSLLGWYELSGIKYDVHCLFRDEVGKAGVVSGGRMDFSSRFDLEGPDGYQETEFLNSNGIRSESGIDSFVQFTLDGDTIATAKWIGGVTYGEFCPDQDQVSSVQTSEDGWYMASNVAYFSYKEKYDELIDQTNILYSQALNDALPRSTNEDLQLLINQLESRRSAAMIENTINSGSTSSMISGSQAIIQLERDHLIFAPEFEITIDADWLKFVYLVGMPEITDIDYTLCEEGSEFNEVEVTVVNVGEAAGEFIADISCDSGIGIATTQRSISLDPDESGTIKIPFDISLQVDDLKRCEVTVSDSNNFENSDMRTISMDCVASVFCEPEGTKRCVGQTEQVCKSGNWIETGTDSCVPQDKCNKDGVCQAFSGESFSNCGGKSDPLNDCATCDEDGACGFTETIYSCQQDCGTVPPLEIPTWVYIAGGVAAAVGVYYLFTRRKKR
jgi:hypothetical protein